MSWAMTALLVMSSTELVVSFNSGNELPRQAFDPWLLLLRRAHRGLRHGWGVRVRGQKTCTTGRNGKTVGVARKKGQ